MRNFTILSLIIVLLFLTACSKNKENVDESIELIEKESDFTLMVQQNVKEAIEMDSLRKQIGENSIIHYSVLQKCFPESIVGYISEEPTGEMVDFAGEMYSSTAIHFVKNGQEDCIDLKIMDLNKAINTYTSSVGLWAMGYYPNNEENSNEIIKSNLKNTICYKSFDKLSKEASVYCGIDHRFLVEILATNQNNTKLVQEVLELMNLEMLLPNTD